MYLKTLCDGLKCVDSTADVRDNAQFIAYNRCTLFRVNRHGRKVFVWPASACNYKMAKAAFKKEQAVREFGYCDKRGTSGCKLQDF